MEDREEIRILTDEEIARLRDVAYNGYFLEFTSRGGKPVRSGPYPLKQAKFFIFAMNVGLRKGELMALKYSDVDFDKKCITIKSNRTVAKRREAG
jgi:integrase